MPTLLFLTGCAAGAIITTAFLLVLVSGAIRGTAQSRARSAEHILRTEGLMIERNLIARQTLGVWRRIEAQAAEPQVGPGNHGGAAANTSGAPPEAQEADWRDIDRPTDKNPHTVNLSVVRAHRGDYDDGK